MKKLPHWALLITIALNVILSFIGHYLVRTLLECSLQVVMVLYVDLHMYLIN